jgi:GNAT superfamily N-acetyltransferase
MSPSVHIRDPAAHERPQLLALHKQLYIAHRESVLQGEELLATQFRNFEEVLTQDLLSLLRDRQAVVLVAVRDDVLVGYISARIQEDGRRVLPRRGDVEDWFVVDNGRGQGIGRALMTEMQKRLRSLGCQLMQSSTWARNKGALAAHEAVGFRPARVTFRLDLD